MGVLGDLLQGHTTAAGTWSQILEGRRPPLPRLPLWLPPQCESSDKRVTYQVGLRQPSRQPEHAGLCGGHRKAVPASLCLWGTGRTETTARTPAARASGNCTLAPSIEGRSYFFIALGLIRALRTTRAPLRFLAEISHRFLWVPKNGDLGEGLLGYS